jgi:hypothetical protein
MVQDQDFVSIRLVQDQDFARMRVVQDQESYRIRIVQDQDLVSGWRRIRTLLGSQKSRFGTLRGSGLFRIKDPSTVVQD